ncbi:hypothetical protein GCM10010405_13970 [Streptomyces macrosporus]|uniref:Uncharacterized protein n=1 Tax=Streptomyces macrosporus TaxID=44032 RepID=A0ABP5WNV4_9ACTN
MGKGGGKWNDLRVAGAGTASEPSWAAPFTGPSPRRFAPLFGISKSAADRIIDHLGPALALRPRR